MTQLINQMQERAQGFERTQSLYAVRVRSTYYNVRHNIFRFRNAMRSAKKRAGKSMTAFVERHPLLGGLSLLFSAPLAVLGFVFAATTAIVVPVALLLGFA